MKIFFAVLAALLVFMAVMGYLRRERVENRTENAEDRIEARVDVRQDARAE